MKEIIRELRFAIYSTKMSFKSQTELRATFIMFVFGMAINNIAFLIVWMSFGAIAGDMGGWTYVDYLLSIGISTSGFGFAYAFFGGIRDLPSVVRLGDFDKYLLSPKNSLLRISTARTIMAALGDLLFGVVCILAWLFLTNSFDLFTLVSIIYFTILSVFIWYFFSVFGNTVAFYFADGRSIAQGIFESLLTPSIFYGGAFQGVLRFIFIVIVPAMLVGNLPLELIKSPNPISYLFVLFMTIFWGVFSVWFYNRSVKKYESSNFIGTT